MKRILFLFLMLLPLCAVAQDKAVALLDKAVAAIRSDAAVQMDYGYTVYDDDGEVVYSDKGTMKLDNERYSLIMEDMKVWCDGATQWSYMREVDEVYVTDANSDEAQNLSPLYIMEHCRDGHSVSATSKGGVVAVALQALGEDSGVDSVLLLIRESDYRLVSMVISMPGQGSVQVDLDGYLPGCGAGDDVFKCPLDQFGASEIIDMR